MATDNGRPPLIIIGESGGPVGDPEARWLLDTVDEWRVRSEVPRHRPGWFSASELGEDDETLIERYRGVLRYNGHTARELRVFDNGRDRDGSWKRYLQEAGLSAVGEEDAREIVINHLRLRGSLDDIARNPDTGDLFVIEFKTMNPYLYGRLHEPKPEHKLQVMAYMAATAIHQSMVLYESKGDQAVRGFYVPFDGVVWNEQAARLVRLRREAERRDAALPAGVKDAGLRLVEALTDGG